LLLIGHANLRAVAGGFYDAPSRAPI